jgi:hypothetical protein
LPPPVRPALARVLSTIVEIDIESARDFAWGLGSALGECLDALLNSAPEPSERGLAVVSTLFEAAERVLTESEIRAIAQARSDDLLRLVEIGLARGWVAVRGVVPAFERDPRLSRMFEAAMRRGDLTAVDWLIGWVPSDDAKASLEELVAQAREPTEEQLKVTRYVREALDEMDS